MATRRRAQGSARALPEKARRASEARSAPVISHVVLFRPKPDLSPADRDGLIAAFRTAVLEIPTVRGVRAGRRVTHGAAYEQTAANLDILIAIEFDDLAGLQTYLRHPAHAELGARFNQAMDSGMVYDFEVGSDLEGQLRDRHV
jgi:hypothetical protein